MNGTAANEKTCPILMVRKGREAETHQLQLTAERNAQDQYDKEAMLARVAQQKQK